MSRRPREPLDAEERALVSRLPRLHGRDQPDPSLDARILAAAEAALATAPTLKRRRGWIVPLTAAASVSLAVGLAWQLQPPAVPVQAPGAAAGYAADAAEATARMNEAAPMHQQAIAPAPPPSAAEKATAAVDATHSARKAWPAESRADTGADTPGVVPAPRSVAAAPQPAASPPPPPPPAPPSAVPAAPAPAAVAASQAEAARRVSDESAVHTQAATTQARASRARPERDEAGIAADAVSAESFAQAPEEEDVPPATMAGPAARDAWLRRIVQLEQQGRVDEAKASLAEFRRRYPDAELPPEVRKLEP